LRRSDVLLQTRVAVEAEFIGEPYDRGAAGTDAIRQIRDGAKGKQGGLCKNGLGDTPLRWRELAADSGNQIQSGGFPSARIRTSSVHIVTLAQFSRSMCYITCSSQH